MCQDMIEQIEVSVGVKTLDVYFFNLGIITPPPKSQVF